MNSSFSPTPFAAQLSGVSRNYMLGKTTVPALCSANLNVFRGEFLVITGPSGSGKSTLLNTLGCIDRPDEGEVKIAGQDVMAMQDKDLTQFRSSNIGFVFQSFNLLPVMTALENVEYPLQLTISNKTERSHLAEKALETVGLSGLKNRKPSELSGGQRQRVAIARAIVRKPILVIADEPTANLDSATATEIITLMRQMQKNHNTTFIFSSHDPQLIESADRVVTLVDGVVKKQSPIKVSIST